MTVSPGFAAPVGEFTILVGAFNRNWWWAVAGAIGIVLGAAYMLWMYQRVFFGPLTNPKNEKLQDLEEALGNEESVTYKSLQSFPRGRSHTHTRTCYIERFMSLEMYFLSESKGI